MKKRDRGFALLLMGIIFSVPDPIWYIGLVLGLIGLILVFLSKDNE